MEKEIRSYLVKYGNTKEMDMINFCKWKFNYSPMNAKKIIKRMVIEGKIHHVVHDQLKPPEVYISLKESFSPKIKKQLDRLLTIKELDEDTRKILEEAALFAEKKMDRNQVKGF